MNIKEKFDLVIVLCPGLPRVISIREIMWPTLDPDKQVDGKMLYAGGPIRMQAAVDIQENVSKYVVVGGSKEKVDAMKTFLEQQNVPSRNIIRIESEADSNGNLHAVRRILEKYEELQKLEKRNVGILTNAYHMPRVKMMANDIFKGDGINFQWLEAESIITRYKPDFYIYPEEFQARQYHEECGIRDWRNGTYKDQYKRDWKAVIYDADRVATSKLNK